MNLPNSDAGAGAGAGADVRDIGGITDENRGLAAGAVPGVAAGVAVGADGPVVNTAGGGTAGHPANPANPVDDVVVDGVDGVDDVVVGSVAVPGTGRVDNFI
jgi:hypothetical protein